MEAETTKSEKIADRPHRTTVVLSLFAVVVAIGSAAIAGISVHIAHLQYELARDVKEKADAAAKQHEVQQERMLAATEKAAAGQKELADEATNSLELARSQLQAQFRPWLRVAKVEVVPSPISAKDDIITIINQGTSQTEDVVAKCFVVTNTIPAGHPLDETPKTTKADLGILPFFDLQTKEVGTLEIYTPLVMRFVRSARAGGRLAYEHSDLDCGITYGGEFGAKHKLSFTIQLKEDGSVDTDEYSLRQKTK